MASPSILDSLPYTTAAGSIADGGANVVGKYGSAASTSWTYNIPSGSNKVLVVILLGLDPGSATPTVSQNSTNVPMTALWTSATAKQTYLSYGVLAAPTNGTFSASWTGGATQYAAIIFTVQDAAQSSTVDVTGFNNFASSNTDTVSATTSNANDLLIDASIWGGSQVLSYGTFSTLLSSTVLIPTAPTFTMGYLGVSTSGSKSSQTNSTGSNTGDHALIAIKGIASSGPANLKTYNTNAKANIKTMNTNPIANVKTFDTNP